MTKPSTPNNAAKSKQDKPQTPPGPRGYPFVGSLPDIDTDLPLQTFMHLADTYGPIFQLQLGSAPPRIFISSVELLDEACDEKRYGKIVSSGLLQLRKAVGAGLFTADTTDPMWGIAHRILMPAFGPLAMKGMFDDMHDIASQLVMKWARHGPENKILATDDFTRLTLDTLALCSMNYRFNSFYTSEMHPFVNAMVRHLVEAGNRASRPSFATKLMIRKNAEFDRDIKIMKDTSSEIIKARREHPDDRKDLLNSLIYGKDLKTGQGLPDDLIIANLITFLIAGHETTSGLLSFAFYQLLKNSSAYRAAQKEVDEVVGKGPITYDHLSKLKYIPAVLRETLRLTPTAPMFTVSPKADLDEDPPTIGNGKWKVNKGQPVVALLPKVHRDPVVYGEDAEEFKPERMLDENFEKLPKAAWKPFGNGMRACIGRPFAWQEAMLVMCMLLQNFNFRLADPNYQLELKQTLTIKPKDFYFHATLREGIDATHLEKTLAGTTAVSKDAPERSPVAKSASIGKKPTKNMSIFYGSNTGTCEALARQLSTDAASHGFNATVKDLDAATQNIPKEEPVIIITASYEGQPPDNATHFVEWIQSLEGEALAGTNYAVFGCGHRDWQATFQRIPTLVDDTLRARGGARIVSKGSADAADGDMFTEFDTWADSQFWPTIDAKFGGTASSGPSPSSIVAELSSETRASSLRMDVQEALVTAASVLTAPGEPEKRHLEIALPTGTTYRAGDYIAVLPVNPKPTVRRVMHRFKLPWDAKLQLTASAPTVLPTDRPVSAHDIFTAYVELSQPATKKNLQTLLSFTSDETITSSLQNLIDNFREEITAKRISPLDLLEKFPTLQIPIGDFLAMLPPMRVRQYSISSSPLHNPDHCTLTYSKLETTALAGGGRKHIGVASAYLATLEPGDILQISVKPAAKFHLPLDISTPVIMIAAGTGIAPFRGFVQERAVQKKAGRKLGRAVLFFGCRHSEKDRLYSEEFDSWEKDGVVEVKCAFSKEEQKSGGCRYVQDRMRREKELLLEMWRDGAKVYVCGSGKIAENVREVCRELYQGEAQFDEWFEGVREERFATDVFD